MTTSLVECSVCGYQWDTLAVFLSDPKVSIVGYQSHFDEMRLGVLLFNHDCNGTLSIPVERFKFLHHGPVFKKRPPGQERRPDYCLYDDTNGPCPDTCECAYVNVVMQRIRRWKKRQPSS